MRLAPQRQVRQRVGTHQKKEFAVWLLDAQLPQRLDRVRQAAPFEFDAADSKSRIARDGKLQHLRTLIAGRDGSERFVRRFPARQKQHAIQFARFAASLGQQQVTEMNRIARAAIDSEANWSLVIGRTQMAVSARRTEP